MSGHSKWSTIKHKKAKEDAKRGKAFTKLIKEITVAARAGGGDPNANPRLRLLIEKAKQINMPAENIMRAIKKGTGELPGITYEEFIYEGYGPNGVAVMLETLTDNKNRTVANLRHIFTAHGGNLSESGSVSWMFEKMGIIRITGKGITEDNLLEKLIEFDIKDIWHHDTIFSVLCDPKSLEAIKQDIDNMKLTIESADVEWVPKTMITLPDNQAEKVFEFLTKLQDHDDIKNVYTNLR